MACWVGFGGACFLVMGAGVAGFSELMGLPLLVAYLVAIAEVLAGIGILAGSFMGGMNFQVVLLLMALYFLIRGNDK